MAILRSLLAYVLMLTNAFLSSGWMYLTATRSPLVRRLEMQQAMARRARAILAAVCCLRCRVVGAENLPAAPFVIMPLHQSAFETLVFPALFPPFVWVLKESLVRVPILGRALARLEPVAIDRSDPRVALRQVLEQGGEKLSRGISVLVFPEGTRHAPGNPGRFHSSGAALALGAKAPIVPVVHDAGRFWKGRGFVIRPGVITVCIGAPIMPDAFEDRSPREIMREVRESAASGEVSINRL